MNFLVIYLNKTASNQMSFRIITFCYGHNLAKCSRDYALTLLCIGPHHRMGFATSRLPIGKYSTVITI